MKHIYSYDETGKWTPQNDLAIDEHSVIPQGNYTDVSPPVPNWKPVFINGEWVETATEAEKNPPITPQPPSIEEQLKLMQAALDELILGGGL